MDAAPSVEQVAELLRENMMESPYTTLAAALGLGFFVGGGYWKSLAQAALAFGARHAIEQVVSRTPRTDR